MRLTLCGVGPGDPSLVTLKASHAITNAPLVLLPRVENKRGTPMHHGNAERVAFALRPNAPVMYIYFPMIRDAQERDRRLRLQLEESRAIWKKAPWIVMPVLGDPSLYATSHYLVAQWSELTRVDVEVIPGISAHSVLASACGETLAMDDQSMTVVPCTMEREKLISLLKVVDSAALYKSSALGDDLGTVIEETGPWEVLIRGDNLSCESQTLVEGLAALESDRPYMSTLLLKRRA